MPFCKGDPNINRKGRPPTDKTLSNAIREALQKNDVKKGYEQVTRNQAIAEILTQEALKGNLKAIDMVLDRMEGKAMQHSEVDIDATTDIPLIKIVHEKK